jgi:hypothetical protein
MRLQRMGCQNNALHRAQPEVHRFGHHAAGTTGRMVRRHGVGTAPAVRGGFHTRSPSCLVLSRTRSGCSCGRVRSTTIVTDPSPAASTPSLTLGPYPHLVVRSRHLIPSA